MLREHDAEIAALAWSLDSSSILCCADQTVKLWNIKVCIAFSSFLLGLCPSFPDGVSLSLIIAVVAGRQTGVCSKEIQDHTQPVSSAKWAYDRSGFYTGGFDTNIYFYVCDAF